MRFCFPILTIIEVVREIIKIGEIINMVHHRLASGIFGYQRSQFSSIPSEDSKMKLMKMKFESK